MTLAQALLEAHRIGGHVICSHTIETYVYEVKPGLDPRAWPEPKEKK